MNKTLLAVLAMTACLTLAAREKMNVLFIMADDLNTHLGCYDHYLVQTPNIDKLASKGALFTRAYCQFPLCGPSRASLLTGLRPEKTNMCINETDFRDALPEVVTLPQLFKRNGYFSGRVGKIFHQGLPMDNGPDGYDDAVSWNARVNPLGRDKTEVEKVINYSPGVSLGVAPAFLAAEGSDLEQTDGMVATETIKMLAEHKDKPFFIAAGFFRPHCPYISPKKYFDLYSLDSIKLPVLPAGDSGNVPPLARANNVKGRDRLTVEQQKNLHRAYFAAISFVDAQVGRLLQALDDLGLSENTIVVFMGDNGYHLGEHRLWGKFVLFEEAARVPLIIYHPKIRPAAKKIDQPVELLDVYPTLASWTGLNPPVGLDRKSMDSLYGNRSAEWKKAALSVVSRPAGKFDRSKVNWGYAYRGASVRTDRWRYTEWDKGEAGAELYDHLNDPGESTNLIGVPGHSEIIKTLRAYLEPGK